MFARALIVLLLVLNVGVAAWWALRPSPAPPPPAEPSAGVARLQLLSETPQRKPAKGSAMITTLSSDPASATSPASRALRCFSFGPFDADQAEALAVAQTRLRPDVARLQVRETQAGSGNGWHVSMPSFADRAAAQAMAERIATAGFKDYYIVSDGAVPDGARAHAIELGRYGSQAAARRRQDSLHAAGFQQARAEPVGETQQQHWIDVAVATEFDAEAMRARINAGQAQPLACDAVR